MADLQELEFEQFSTIVVYEADTGRIVAIHHHSMPRNAQRPDREPLEAQVLRHAARAGIDMSKVFLLHVEPGKLQRGASYKVDVTSKSLVEIPRPR